MHYDLVDNLLPKKTGLKIDLSTPITFLTWRKKIRSGTEYELLPARPGDRLSSGIIVFKEGLLEIEENWYSVPLAAPNGSSTISVFDTGILDFLRNGRDDYIAGMAIKRLGGATSVIAATVWFQDEADAVDFSLRMNNAHS